MRKILKYADRFLEIGSLLTPWAAAFSVFMGIMFVLNAVIEALVSYFYDNPDAFLVYLIVFIGAIVSWILVGSIWVQIKKFLR